MPGLWLAPGMWLAPGLPAALARAANTAWMSQPCRPSCMAGTSTPYALVLTVPE